MLLFCMGVASSEWMLLLLGIMYLWDKGKERGEAFDRRHFF